MFSEWTEHSRGLPTQIALEVHYKALPDAGGGAPPATHPMFGRDELSVSDVALFFSHLANLGYAVVASEPNALNPACSEFTLLRIEGAV